MTKISNSVLVLLFLCLITLAANFTSADVIRGINIDFVSIGHAGNAADTGGTVGRGAVGYNYNIGKYEITNAQWNSFITAAGAPAGSDGGYSVGAQFTASQQPTNNTSWYEAAQFCNWLTSGDKSKGAYQFSGNNTNPGSFLGIDRTAAQTAYGLIYVIPTEDEWYKAAYFKSNGSGYSIYANGTNNDPDAGDDSNYDDAVGSPWNVGSGSIEQNGTFDMMGNVWEWNETFDGANRIIRGGAHYFPYGIESSYQAYANPASEQFFNYGFRIVEIPEPATVLLIGLGGLLLKKKR